ncbi:MAG: cyanophycinase [Gemmatimonadetes bacterium]|nr:cyanophycinase [Gemmatimonadota bacterium]
MKRIILLLLALGTAAAPAPAQEVGPARGSLVVVGGAMSDPAIVDRFITLAGGPDAHIVVIPTAGGAEAYDDFYGGLQQFRERGARNLTVLHTIDPAEADTEAFVAPLRTAGGVFFPGGRQWRLADSYLGTLTQDAVQEVLDRGGVVGGTSAGATILGSYLVRGDTRTNTIMMGDHEEGFGFLRDVAVDQHLLRRNRQFDLLEVVEAHPELLGIGLDENTAIVVQGDRFEVLGEGYVAIYDPRLLVEAPGRFYFLAPGDRFDLATREASRPVGRTAPVPVPWLPERPGGA